MKKMLLFFALITILVVGLYSYAIAPPPAPLLDANRTVLAESSLDAWCSGQLMMAGVPLATCHEDNPDLGRTRSLQQVVPAFCNSIVDAGWGGTYGDCRDIMEAQLYWPIMNGDVTKAWSARYPYPLDRFLEVGPAESRTGDRKEVQR